MKRERERDDTANERQSKIGNYVKHERERENVRENERERMRDRECERENE